MWLARLKARLRGPMVEDALNGRGRSLAVCPACTRLYALGLPCLTCTDPLATVTGVA